MSTNPYANPPVAGYMPNQGQPVSRESLSLLRTGLFVMFLGVILTIIAIGVFIQMVGIILVSIGLLKLSDQPIPSKGFFKATAIVTLLSFVFLIIGAIVGILYILPLFSTVSHITTLNNTTSTPTATSSTNALGSAYFIALFLAFLLYIVSYFMIAFSLRKLGDDLGGIQRLKTGGLYLIISPIIAIFASIVVFVGMYSLIFSSMKSGSIGTNMLSGVVTILIIGFIIMLVAWVIAFLGYHNGYRGIDEYVDRTQVYNPMMGNFQSFPSSQPPIQPPQPPQPPQL